MVHNVYQKHAVQLPVSKDALEAAYKKSILLRLEAQTKLRQTALSELYNSYQLL
jgi:hypothetical protein